MGTVLLTHWDTWDCSLKTDGQSHKSEFMVQGDILIFCLKRNHLCIALKNKKRAMRAF